MIHNLFPIPVLEQNLERNFTENEIEFCNYCENNKYLNEGNTTSENTYVLEDPRLKDIKYFVLQGIIFFSKNILNTSNEITPFITQSWFNYTNQNQFHHSHYHSNSLISGVIYLFSDVDDIITFNKPLTAADYIMDLQPKDFNHYNSPSWWLPAKIGTMYIFPSRLEHGVTIKKSPGKRVSLSFNVFLKGEIGNKKALSFLQL